MRTTDDPMWYLPYWRGASEGATSEAAKLHERTLHVLPLRGDNAGPDLFHMGMHVLFLANQGLASILHYAR